MTEFQQKVIKLIDEGYSVSDVSKILEKPMSSVSSVIKRFNLKVRKVLNQNNINHEYFDLIDSEDKAYYLGFLIADGTISDKKKSVGRIGFLIQEEDSYILEPLRKFLRCDNKIYIRKNNKGALNRKPQASFRWTSKHMMETLRDTYGIFSNKTRNYNFKFNFNLIPNEFIGSLIRGFIDGDGSFESSGGIFTPSIVGTSKSWLIQVGDVVNKNTGLVYKIYEIKGKSCTYYSLRWSAERKDKLSKITKLYEFLYKESTIFLERKRKKIVDYLEYRANQIK